MVHVRWRLQDIRLLSTEGQGIRMEFAEKYLRRGMPVLISGRIQTGSYTDRDGRRVNTFEVVAEEHEFVESRSAAAGNTNMAPAGSGFMDIPQDPGLPFN